MDWFRFYNETCGDPKIRRLSVEHRWLWVAVLSAGSASPVRGRLLLATDQPVTVDDLMDSAKLDRDVVETGIFAFLRQEMLHEEGGVWVISKWDKRQFESDSSTERSRRHRAKKQQAEPESPAANVADGICRNVPETLQQRSGNGPEADTETELTTTPPKARAKVVPSPIARDTAEVLVNAPWVRDDEDAVAAAVERSFKLAPAFDCRDGPLVAEKYVRAKKYQTKPPDDWYRAWLNFVKSERSPHERSTTNGAPKRIDPASQTTPVLGPDPYTSGRFAQYVTKPTG